MRPRPRSRRRRSWSRPPAPPGSSGTMTALGPVQRPRSRLGEPAGSELLLAVGDEDLDLERAAGWVDRWVDAGELAFEDLVRTASDATRTGWPTSIWLVPLGDVHPEPQGSSITSSRRPRRPPASGPRRPAARVTAYSTVPPRRRRQVLARGRGSSCRPGFAWRRRALLGWTSRWPDGCGRRGSALSRTASAHRYVVLGVLELLGEPTPLVELSLAVEVLPGLFDATPAARRRRARP